MRRVASWSAHGQATSVRWASTQALDNAARPCLTAVIHSLILDSASPHALTALGAHLVTDCFRIRNLSVNRPGPALHAAGRAREVPSMALADRLKSTKPNPTGMPCSIQVLLDTLDGDELDALKHMLSSRQWSQSMVWKA